MVYVESVTPSFALVWLVKLSVPSENEVIAVSV